MSLHFSKERSAIIHSSWHDPRKVREMTIVGSKRMIVYDDIATQEKIKIHDVRVERPPHYDTFAAFHYAYHYGDTYSPFIVQEEPLKTECNHFIDCIQQGMVPLTDGQSGLEVVRILEAASESLRNNGAPVDLWPAPAHSQTPFPFSRSNLQSPTSAAQQAQALRNGTGRSVAPFSPKGETRKPFTAAPFPVKNGSARGKVAASGK